MLTSRVTCYDHGLLPNPEPVLNIGWSLHDVGPADGHVGHGARSDQPAAMNRAALPLDDTPLELVV